MDFKDLNIEREYRIPRDNIIKEMYIPLLKNAIEYKRSVGYFSSTSLVEISIGIVNLINNNGKMSLIVSPYLSDEDIEAINKGYEIRDDIIEKAMLKYITEPQSYFEKESMNLLATLIAQEKLDIKIAFSYKKEQLGLYHEKLGLFYDAEGNAVAFSGSMNETASAHNNNYEVIDVFCSWQSSESYDRVKDKEIAFEKLWNDTDENARVIEFPKIVKEKLLTYKQNDIDYDLLNNYNTIERDILNKDKHEALKHLDKATNIPKMPEGFSLHAYQKEAIDNWMDKNSIGIFDMATGTGKTFTGLGAITRLYEKLNDKMSVIIVCPYQHLVDQWVEDITKFNIVPIIRT